MAKFVELARVRTVVFENGAELSSKNNMRGWASKIVVGTSTTVDLKKRSIA
jgi:hypothetical protein